MPKTNVSPLNYPHYGAGTVEVVTKEQNGSDYAILFAPDPNNNELREAGLPMQFYYYPKVPRLAKHSDGRFKFSMQIFKGTADEGTVIGAEGLEEEAGAFTSLTSTIDIPEDVLKKAIDQLQEKLVKQFGTYEEGLRGLFNIGNKLKLTPANIRPIQLTENTITMHVIGEDSGKPFGGSNPWTHNIQGGGEGQTSGLGENAFSMLMGRNTASLLKASLEAGSNNLVVENLIKYKAYMPSLIIKTTVKGEKVQNYFSSKYSGGDLIPLDWENEYESLKTEGHIESEIFCDETITDEDKKKLADSLLEKQREEAFKALQKCIFEPADKEYEPAKDPENRTKGKKRFLFWTYGGYKSHALSLKTGHEERNLDYTDEVKFSGVYELSSKISGTLDPLIDARKGDNQLLSQYIQEVRLDEDFSKLHIVAMLAGELAESSSKILYSPVKKVSIEVGYPDSKGNVVWKSSARMIPSDGSGNPYVQKTSRDGEKQIDAIYPAIWSSNEMADNLFVFDFVRNDNPTPAKLRQKIFYVKNEYVCLKDKEVVKEIQGSKCDIEFPEIRMLDYKFSPELLYECDTLEVTLKADTVGTSKFTFTAENYDEAIPFKVWYEKDQDIKPAQYKLKYTCKGKVAKTLKRETIITDWITLDFDSGDVNLQIPEGTEKQNATINSIRKKFMEEEE